MLRHTFEILAAVRHALRVTPTINRPRVFTSSSSSFPRGATKHRFLSWRQESGSGYRSSAFENIRDWAREKRISFERLRLYIELCNSSCSASPFQLISETLHAEFVSRVICERSSPGKFYYDKWDVMPLCAARRKCLNEIKGRTIKNMCIAQGRRN